jgi:hypothetical protein
MKSCTTFFYNVIRYFFNTKISGLKRSVEKLEVNIKSMDAHKARRKYFIHTTGEEEKIRCHLSFHPCGRYPIHWEQLPNEIGVMNNMRILTDKGEKK